MANQPLYNRVINVSIAGINKTYSYPNLKIEFEGQFNEDDVPNTTTLTIYNLSNNSISQIDIEKAIILNAGYVGDVGTITAGVITKVTTDNENVDRATTIEIQDASNEWLNVNVSKTFRGSIKSSDVIKTIAAEIGLEIGKIELVNDITYQTGKTVFGRLSDIIRGIASETGSSMNINNGKIDIVAKKIGFETGFLLNSKTGLIVSPQKIDDQDNQSEYLVKMLMNHHVRPKTIFQIESKTINGLYFCVRGKYNTDFTMDVEVARLV